VISLTHNRPKYIERSFESLYKRAGCKFTHYVFDDASDDETRAVLKKLKSKYGFILYSNEERLNIYLNFHKNVREIPDTFDYYIKMDSDIEILSDGLISLALRGFNYPEKISGIVPRVEGIRNVDRYEHQIEFFGGHAIKFNAPIVYGCFLILTKEAFFTFERMSDKKLLKCEEKWGVDSMLYDHALKVGKFLIMEDLSVYHIDNAYGQRRIDKDYFTNRKRWNIIDNIEVLCMKTSEKIYPSYLNRSEYEKIRTISPDNLDEFIERCKKYIKDHTSIEKEALEAEKKTEEEKDFFEKNALVDIIYKISSPLNYPPDKNIKHGTFKYFAAIPDWAKNNHLLVVEKEKFCRNKEIIKTDDPE